VALLQGVSSDVNKQEYLELADDIEDVDPELAEAMRRVAAEECQLVIEINLHG
jgi:hypothetical protein